MIRYLLSAVMVSTSLMMAGCTSSEESETLSALEAALASLNQNRTLIEQYGRDVQSRIDTSSETYTTLMQQYEEARDAYNQYLDSVEHDVVSKHHQADVSSTAHAAREASAEFMANATRALDSKAPLRGVVFREAISLPDGLARDLRRIPKADRQGMMDIYANQLKIRSWGRLTAADPDGTR
jgi:hypothetical protein